MVAFASLLIGAACAVAPPLKGRTGVVPWPATRFANSRTACCKMGLAMGSPAWRRPELPPRRLGGRLTSGRTATRVWLAGLILWLWRTLPAIGGGGGASVASSGALQPLNLPLSLLGWGVLFVLAACFAAAETAITTLWPWKIKKIVAEEGPRSNFSPLQSNISGVLTTLLIGVTICTVYSTALATLIATQVFGSRSLNAATLALTLLTLIFAEILPKTVAVSNAEQIARVSMPFINGLASLLAPVSFIVSLINSALTRLMGVADELEGAVSQPELKLMLMGAMKSGSIANYEVEMIEGVLGMETTQVKEVMKPRVDVVAVDASASVADLLAIVKESKFSRVPVYEDTIDNIIGVARAQSLLPLAERAGRHTEADLSAIAVAEVMEPTDFIPQTMAVMNALKVRRPLGAGHEVGPRRPPPLDGRRCESSDSTCSSSSTSTAARRGS